MGWFILSLVIGIFGSYLCFEFLPYVVVPIMAVMVGANIISIKSGRRALIILSSIITTGFASFLWIRFIVLAISNYPEYGNVWGIIFSFVTVLAILAYGTGSILNTPRNR